jgi:hypothetical protein
VPQQAGVSNADLSRVIQGLVAGIGFVGAGAILKPEQLGPLVWEALGGAGEVEVYLIDEVGKMELLCPAFVEAVPRLLGVPGPGAVTCSGQSEGDPPVEGRSGSAL